MKNAKPLFATILVLFLSSFGFASTIFDALSYESIEQAEINLQLDLALSKLGPLSGFNAGIALTPSINITDTLNDENEASFSGIPRASFDLDYRLNQTQIIRDERSALSLEKRLIQQKVNDAYSAMTALLEVLRSDLALKSANTNLEKEQLELNDAQEKFNADSITRLDLNQASLEFDLASVALQQAELRFSNANLEAQKYNVLNPEAFEPIFFLFPSFDINTSFGLQEQMLLIQESEAALNSLLFLSTLDDLKLEASYSAPGIGTSVTAGIIDKLPGANFSLDFPGAANPNWKIGVSAEIRFDVNRLTAIQSEELRLAERQTDVEEYVLRLNQEVERFNTAALLAEESVLLSVQALDLASRRVDELLSTQAELTERKEAASGDELTTIENDLNRVNNDIARALSNQTRAQDAVYSNYLSYIRSVRDVLLRTESEWLVAVVD